MCFGDVVIVFTTFGTPPFGSRSLMQRVEGIDTVRDLGGDAS